MLTRLVISARSCIKKWHPFNTWKIVAQSDTFTASSLMCHFLHFCCILLGNKCFSDSVLRIKHLCLLARSVWLMSPYSRAANPRPTAKSSRIKGNPGAFPKEKVLWTLCLSALWSWKETRKRSRGTALASCLFCFFVCFFNERSLRALFCKYPSRHRRLRRSLKLHRRWCWDHTASN